MKIVRRPLGSVRRIAPSDELWDLEFVDFFKRAVVEVGTSCGVCP
jgi:hypothetical protein